MKQIFHGHLICILTAGYRRDAARQLARGQQPQPSKAMIWKIKDPSFQ
jgi:hypothetical protein